MPFIIAEPKALPSLHRFDAVVINGKRDVHDAEKIIGTDRLLIEQRKADRTSGILDYQIRIPNTSLVEAMRRGFAMPIGDHINVIRTIAVLCVIANHRIDGDSNCSGGSGSNTEEQNERSADNSHVLTPIDNMWYEAEPLYQSHSGTIDI